MGTVFLSYAREDQQIAVRLASVLSQRGWSVWWDNHLLPGTDFDTAIEQGLASASCVVVLWTPHSIKSRWVRTEASEGLQRNILVSVVLSDVVLPIAFRLIDFARPRLDFSEADPEVQRILARISALVGPPNPTRSQAVYEPISVGASKSKGHPAPDTPSSGPSESTMPLVRRLRSRPTQIAAAEMDQLLKSSDFCHTAVGGTFLGSLPVNSAWQGKLSISEDRLTAFDPNSALFWAMECSKTMRWDDVANYIVLLNAGTFGGYNDWRLPTVDEAMSVIRPDKSNRLMDSHLAPELGRNGAIVWTSDWVDESHRWVLNFGLAMPSRPSTGFFSRYAVRAVR